MPPKQDPNERGRPAKRGRGAGGEGTTQGSGFRSNSDATPARSSRTRGPRKNANFGKKGLADSNALESTQTPVGNNDATLLQPASTLRPSSSSTNLAAPSGSVAGNTQTQKRTPRIAWNQGNDRQLLLIMVDRELKGRLNAAIANTFTEKPTVAAVADRMDKLRKEAKKLVEQKGLRSAVADNAESSAAAMPSLDLDAPVYAGSSIKWKDMPVALRDQIQQEHDQLAALVPAETEQQRLERLHTKRLKQQKAREAAEGRPDETQVEYDARMAAEAQETRVTEDPDFAIAMANSIRDTGRQSKRARTTDVNGQALQILADAAEQSRRKSAQ